jgi:hypothetical protein
VSFLPAPAAAAAAAATRTLPCLDGECVRPDLDGAVPAP